MDPRRFLRENGWLALPLAFLMLAVLIVAGLCVGGWMLVNALNALVERTEPVSNYVLLGIGYLVTIVEVARRIAARRRRIAGRTQSGIDSGSPPTGEGSGERT